MRKAKMELTAETVRKAIGEGQPASMTQLAHKLGYKGSVSSSLTRKFRLLVPDIDALLKGAAEAAKAAKPAGDAGKAGAEPKAKKVAKGKAKPSAKAGKWPRDERSPFRPGSSYDTCFSILAAHPDGLPRAKLVELLAKATGKDVKHASYDAQVLLSAHPNEDGLSNNDSPRHRSCRPGFYVVRTNGHVRLVVDR
jgi:hypothetical protein